MGLPAEYQIRFNGRIATYVDEFGEMYVMTAPCIACCTAIAKSDAKVQIRGTDAQGTRNWVTLINVEVGGAPTCLWQSDLDGPKYDVEYWEVEFCEDQGSYPFRQNVTRLFWYYMTANEDDPHYPGFNHTCWLLDNPDSGNICPSNGSCYWYVPLGYSLDMQVI